MVLNRLLRIGLVSIVALSAISCSRAEPTARVPARFPTSTFSRDAATPEAPAAAVAAMPAASAASTVIIYSQPPKANGLLLQSSWRAPGGSDTDRYVWENFGFEKAQTLSEVRWQGGYDPAKKGSGGPVQDFTIDIYSSIPAGSEPDLARAPLVHFRTGGDAGETLSEIVGGVQTYAYRYALPVPFAAEPETTYWIQIQAFQAGAPDWGLSAGSGTLGDGRHFRGRASGYYFQLVLEDAAIAFGATATDGQAPVPEIAASPEDIAEMLKNLPPPERAPINGEGVQEVKLVVSRSGYTPVHFAVKAGVPVRLSFRQIGYVPGGNELLIQWGDGKQGYLILASATDKKELDFTPQEPGEFKFSCPHDWYEGVMTVEEAS